MAYYSKNNTTDLANLGKEAFDDIDNIYSHGRNSKHSAAAATVPSTGNTQDMFHYHQYQPQQAYVVQQQVYNAPVAAMRTERVINCNEAAKMYGGTVYVDYPKRKPARKGFFF